MNERIALLVLSLLLVWTIGPGRLAEAGIVSEDDAKCNIRRLASLCSTRGLRKHLKDRKIESGELPSTQSPTLR